MEQSSKAIVRNLFELRDLPRVPFIPWVCNFAARVEQIELEAMLSDPGLLSKSVINAQKLFGYDAIATAFDTSLEAEACGCEIDWGDGSSMPAVVSHPLSQGANIDDLDITNFDKHGRVPAVLEATKRMKAIRGKDVAIIGVVTGPLTLAGHLRGDAFLNDIEQGSEATARLIAATGNIALKLARSYCELGVDAIAVAEETLCRIPPTQCQAAAAPLRSIWNVARFYNVHSLLVSKACRQASVEPVLGLQADATALSGDIDYLRLGEAARKRNSCYSRPVPDSNLLGPISRTNASINALFSARGKGFFLSTEWEVPSMADVNAVHEVMGMIRSQTTPE